jgi:hypothetical protein
MTARVNGGGHSPPVMEMSLVRESVNRVAAGEAHPPAGETKSTPSRESGHGGGEPASSTY